MVLYTEIKIKIQCFAFNKKDILEQLQDGVTTLKYTIMVKRDFEISKHHFHKSERKLAIRSFHVTNPHQ